MPPNVVVMFIFKSIQLMSKSYLNMSINLLNYCNILFWNIHGQKVKSIGNKFTDIEFLNICDKSDILGLAELHTSDKPSIEGFKLIKDKIRKKTHKGPKIAGGLALFVKKEIAHMVKYVANNCEDSIWVKLCKEATGEPQDIFLGTCYISPQKRSYNKKRQGGEAIDKGEGGVNQSSLEKIFEEAVTFSKKGEVILQGDFNARIGTEPDFLHKDKFDDTFGIINHDDNPPRNSEDKKVCERGSLFIDLCRSFDLRVANGRKTGDIFGKFTSMQWNGSAVVDYVLTPASSSNKITKLKVGKFSPWLSDHCPLIYEIKTNLKKGLKNENPVEAAKTALKLKWNDESRVSFIENLNSENIKTHFDRIIEDQASPEKTISDLTSILRKCASIENIVTSTKKSDIRKNDSNKPWFDQE